jgi:hypothetical protein
VDGSVDLGVELQEGGEADVELRDTSEVADPCGYTLAYEWESGPAGQAQYGGERTGSLGGDVECGLPAVFGGASGAA